MASGPSSRKRLFDRDPECEEFQELSGINSPIKFAKLHGVLATVSPMKKSVGGCSYFDGTLTDGQKNIRLVGFNTKIQQKLADFKDRNEPVAILNCEVKEGKYTSDLEVHMRNSTDVQRSPNKVDVASIVANLPTDLVTLDQIPSLANFQRVTVKIKVITIKEEEEVKKNLFKQECIIGDATATTKICMWEDNVGILAEKQSYEQE